MLRRRWRCASHLPRQASECRGGHSPHHRKSNEIRQLLPRKTNEICSQLPPFSARLFPFIHMDVAMNSRSDGRHPHVRRNSSYWTSLQSPQASTYVLNFEFASITLRSRLTIQFSTEQKKNIFQKLIGKEGVELHHLVFLPFHAESLIA
jgi:hypothetical protein